MALVLVDEYQDLNAAQAELVWLLVGSDGNVTVVGDEDQLVHRYRGADPAHMARIGERYPRHRTIVLCHSFRSRAEILEGAASCVRHNPGRQAKRLVAVRGAGGRVSVKAFQDDWHGAHWIAREVADAIASGVPGPEILVLARTSYATQPIQAALARAGIAHRVLGSLGLFERSEVKDALAYLTLLANPADAQAFRRAISSPRRGIGPATATAVVRRAREELEGDLIVACAGAQTLPGIRSQPARDNLQAFEERRGAPAPVGEFLEHAIGLHAQELAAGEDRRVTVSTVHRAKGTEAQLVVVLGLDEQVLPCWQALSDPDRDALCEERRLFYVACTRAKDTLILAHAGGARRARDRRAVPVPGGDRTARRTETRTGRVTSYRATVAQIGLGRPN